MSLHRRLILAVTLLVLALLCINLVITLHNARLNIYEQLKVHAQDTATSLGFSMSQAALDKDDIQIQLMVDAVFDRGYYRRILYRNIEGEEQLKRELPLSTSDVPNWFIAWLPLPEPSGVAEVTSGWYQLGQVEVVSHPGFAYQDLWRSFKEQLWLFGVTIVICYALLGFGLRMVLTPLRKVEQQADAICRKEFSVQDEMPNIPELRSVVDAMNRMVVKVKGMFNYQVEVNERLYEQLNTDTITGLANREYFDKSFSAAISVDRAAVSGALYLIRAADLPRVNRQKGRQAGDEYLALIANELSLAIEAYPNALLSRHSGADFAIFVPAVNEGDSQSLLEQFYASLQSFEWQSDEVHEIYIGALFIPKIKSSANYLALADASLSQAQSEGVSGTCWNKVSKDEKVLSVSEWSKLLYTALHEESFRFLYQPVWQVVHGEKSLLFNEVMIRMSTGEYEYSAGQFMPMATRFQLLPAIDDLVVRHLIQGLQELPENICINCSLASIEEEPFVEQIRAILHENAAIAPRLTFELPANGLSIAPKAVRHFAEVIKQYGAHLSLHHFGRGSAEFAYLQSLPVDYLKIDRQFIQHVEDADNQFFIRSLVAIAHSCDIIVLAEGVETEEQWRTLMDLGVQGGQGYWLGKPSLEHIIG
jgi:EAL domain-containing protein (putative c-di-GMP-specific phosphodiesterase class I)/GGDEF domain-containing protein